VRVENSESQNFSNVICTSICASSSSKHLKKCLMPPKKLFPFSTLRSKLVESEAMNESLRRQVTRLSGRSPCPASMLSPAPGHPIGSSPAPRSMEAEMTDVIRRAKLDIKRLKKKERRQRRMRWERGGWGVAWRRACKLY